MQSAQVYHYPGQNPAMYAAPAAAAGAGAGAAAAYGAYRGSDTDQVPLTREFDDFSRGFNDALERIGEEDGNETDFADYYTGNNGGGMNGSMAGNGNGNGNGNGGGAAGAGPGQVASGEGQRQQSDGSPARPLWQQNRRQSRNLMWM